MTTSLSLDPVAVASLPEALTEALRPRIERLGYLGEFFTCAAHQPDALLAFMDFTAELKRALAPNHTELIALSVATAFGNDYERHQHERLSLKLGFSRDWIRTVERLEPAAATELTDIEREVQSLVLAVIENRGHVPSEDVRTLIEAVGEPEVVGILMLTGRYAGHALMANAFGVRPPVPSIFEELPHDA